MLYQNHRVFINKMVEFGGIWFADVGFLVFCGEISVVFAGNQQQRLEPVTHHWEEMAYLMMCIYIIKICVDGQGVLN